MSHIKELWNAQADKHNQWDELSTDEKIEFTIEQCAVVCDAEVDVEGSSLSWKIATRNCAEAIRNLK